MDSSKVYLVIESKSEDYHGTYKDILCVYSNKDKAQKEVDRLMEKNNDYDTEYYFVSYHVL